MTAFFVQKFKSATKCVLCKKDKVSGYSLCPTHLEAARASFERWADTRRAVGRCIGCDRKSLHARTRVTRGKFELRCWFHARINRERIRAWQAAHPDYSHQAWLKHKDRYEACRDAGHRRGKGRRVCSKCSHRRGWGATQTQVAA